MIASHVREAFGRPLICLSRGSNAVITAVVCNTALCLILLVVIALEILSGYIYVQ